MLVAELIALELAGWRFSDTLPDYVYAVGPTGAVCAGWGDSSEEAVCTMLVDIKETVARGR